MEYSDWRAELSEAQECQCEGCDEEICVECGENCHDVSEAKIDDIKYSKDQKLKDHSKDVHLVHANPGVRQDRNKRHNASDVIFHGHSKVERDRKRKHYASRGIKKEIAGKDHNIDLKTEGLLNFIQTGVRRHNKSINQKKIDAGKAVPYGNMLVNKGKEKVDPKKNPVVASHKLEGDHLQEKDKGMSDKDFIKFNKDMHDTAKAGGGASQETQNKYALELARRRRINKDGTVSTLRNKEIKEEVQGGVSFETYTKGIQFHEVETVDIIKPEPLKPSLKAAEYSDWRGELDK